MDSVWIECGLGGMMYGWVWISYVWCINKVKRDIYSEKKKYQVKKSK